MTRRCSHPFCRTSLDEVPTTCPHGLPFCDHCVWEESCSECGVEATCSIAGCFKPKGTRGWCSMHYGRWKRHGDPLTAKVVHGDEAGRFWPKVDKSGECWLWTGGINNMGYGSFKSSAGNYAHRWSYTEANGSIPPEMVIDHLCRTPACVRPDHLEAVTQQENTLRGLASFELTGKCRRGHDVTDPANVYAGPNYRTCRICRGR